MLVVVACASQRYRRSRRHRYQCILRDFVKVISETIAVLNPLNFSKLDVLKLVAMRESRIESNATKYHVGTKLTKMELAT